MIRRYIKDNHVCVEMQLEDGNYFISKEVGGNRDSFYLDDVAFNLFTTLVRRIKSVGQIMYKIQNNG